MAQRCLPCASQCHHATCAHHILFQASGSILAELKSRGWASSLESGSGREDSSSCSAVGGTVVTVTVGLTHAGVAAWRDVVGVVRSYIVYILCGGGPRVLRVASGAVGGSDDTLSAAATAFPLGRGVSVRAVNGIDVFTPALLHELASHAISSLAWIAEEVSAVDSLRFNYSDDAEDALEEATRLAIGLVCGAADAHAVDGTYRVGPYAAGATAILLAHMLPAAAVRIDLTTTAAAPMLREVTAGDATQLPRTIMTASDASCDVTSRDTAMPSSTFCGTPNVSLLTNRELELARKSVERWFSIQYIVAPVHRATVQGLWQLPAQLPSLRLPLRNPFLPRRLEIKPLDENTAAMKAGAHAATSDDSSLERSVLQLPPPQQHSPPARELRTDKWTLVAGMAAMAPSTSDISASVTGSHVVGRLWWAQDAQFRVPRSSVTVRIRAPCTWALSNAGVDLGAPAVASHITSVAPCVAPTAVLASLLTDFAAAMADDAATDALYYAASASLEGSVRSLKGILEISVEGFSAMLPSLLTTLTKLITPGVEADAEFMAREGTHASDEVAADRLALTAARIAEDLRRNYANELLALDRHATVALQLALWRDSDSVNARAREDTPPVAVHQPVTTADKASLLAAIIGQYTPIVASKAYTDTAVTATSCTASTQNTTVPPAVGAVLVTLWHRFMTGATIGAPHNAIKSANVPTVRPFWWSSAAPREGGPGPVIVEIAVHGNETAADATAIYEAVMARVAAAVHVAADVQFGSRHVITRQPVQCASARAIVPYFVPYGCKRLPSRPAAMASTSVGIAVPCLVVSALSVSREEVGSIVSVYIQTGEDIWEATSASSNARVLPLQRIRLAVLEAVMSEAAFTELRSRQQLGYSVSARVCRDGELERVREGASSSAAPGCRAAIGMVITVESSSHSVVDVEQRILAWLAGYGAELEAACRSQTPAARPRIEKFIAALIASKLAPDSSMAEAADRDWDEVRERRYEFNRLEAEVEALRGTSGDDVLRLWDAAFSPASARVAVVRVVGRSSRDPLLPSLVDAGKTGADATVQWI